MCLFNGTFTYCFTLCILMYLSCIYIVKHFVQFKLFEMCYIDKFDIE